MADETTTADVDFPATRIRELETAARRFEIMLSERDIEAEIMRSRVTQLETVSKAQQDRIAEIRATLEEGEPGEVGELAAGLRQLQVRLFGDAAAQAKYERDLEIYKQARKGYVAPNVAPTPPDPGVIDRFASGISALMQTNTRLNEKMTEVQVTVARRDSFADRVGAWIGPLLDDPSFAPPLNGQQIASKAFVDNSLATFAVAIRREVEAAVHVATRLALVGAHDRGEDRKAVDWRVNIDRAIEVFESAMLYVRDLAERASAPPKPSRFQIARRALGMIVTGELPRE